MIYDDDVFFFFLDVFFLRKDVSFSLLSRLLERKGASLPLSVYYVSFWGNAQSRISRLVSGKVSNFGLKTTTRKKEEEEMNPATTEATTTATTTTTKQPKIIIAGYNDQLPIAPLPDEFKDADESTKQRYFREAKRVAIEKCRENRCGNDEVTAEMHSGPGPEIKEGEECEEGDAAEGGASLKREGGWKRPSLRTCTAQEFAYDFFKFHEQRGEFDYELMWECVSSSVFVCSFVACE